MRCTQYGKSLVLRAHVGAKDFTHLYTHWQSKRQQPRLSRVKWLVWALSLVEGLVPRGKCMF
jgi:hypothetical protein